MKITHALIAGGLLLAATPLSAQPRATGLETLRPDDQSELQWAAGVTKITQLPQVRPDAHLFGVTGGDPAMNGLQTYLAFYESPAEGSKIFRIGDFLDYVVLSQAANRVVLSVRENVMPASGNVGVRWRRLTVTWRVPAGQEVPASISVTSAPGRSGAR